MTKQMPEPLIVADLDAWRAWLLANEETSDGIWLLLANQQDGRWPPARRHCSAELSG